MDLPKYWFIENKYIEVRKYLSNKYKSNMMDWGIGFYDYIGYDGSTNNGGCFCITKNDYKTNSIFHFHNNATKITIEQFREMTQ